MTVQNKFWTVIGHGWTFFLLIGGGLFCWVLPYHAFVENDWLFWAVVAAGLVVSFICAACETAFGLACGESTESRIFIDNSSEQEEYEKIAKDPHRTVADQKNAQHEAAKLELLMEIGARYQSFYNPTLVVTDNIAKIIVSVVSGVAVFRNPVPANAGVDCGTDALPDRCTNIFGHLISIPINTELFQAAFALTLILLVGEIIPKQLGSSSPRLVIDLFFNALNKLSYFALGTGPTFGAIGLCLEPLFARLAANPAFVDPGEGLGFKAFCVRFRNFSIWIPEADIQSSKLDLFEPANTNLEGMVETIVAATAVCDGSDPALGHPRIVIALTTDTPKVLCPYCSKMFVLGHGAPRPPH